MRLLKERADKANARTTASVRELARAKDQLQVGQAAQARLQHDMAAVPEEAAKLGLTNVLRQPSAYVLHHLQRRMPLHHTACSPLRQHYISRYQMQSPISDAIPTGTIAVSGVLQLLLERSGKHTGRLRAELLQSNKERSALESDLQTALDKLAKYKRK